MTRFSPFLIVCLIALLSCQKRLPEPQFNVSEEINGIPVTWREDITDSQQQIIRDILNDMVFVQGGEFWMGATPDQEEYAFHFEYPAHLVRVSDFFISKYELDNSVATRFHSPGYESQTGYENWKYVLQILSEYSGVAFDLPTEAQWEYAARGGVYSAGFLLPGSNNISDVWSYTSYKRGMSQPNELGLYNMADLNQEWCKDAFAFYRTDQVIECDPCVEEILKDYGHVVRGGSHLTSAGSKYSITSFKYKNWFLDKDTAEPDDLLLAQDVRMLRVSARCTFSKESGMDVLIGCRPVINIQK